MSQLLDDLKSLETPDEVARLAKLLGRSEEETLRDLQAHRKDTEEKLAHRSQQIEEEKKRRNLS